MNKVHEKSGFFIGYQEAHEELHLALRAAVLQHITEYGVTELIIGHYGDFDRHTARAVIEAKKLHPEVRYNAVAVSSVRMQCYVTGWL